ncbi:GNAT family N-acetyltransferase [Phycicoccus duodecadis]|uniref:Acetyltransferase (GNAT) family protein n=1 Tax=Phycicoccus duodecadis TaxID=173053 RepID=A0A2N3YHW8_9MICO|nr:GNAT family N-acetyltransferase [Phycicoccus duodecadis]PKW26457.1 acetyltransferase (GNAT) family protein [Phycicoccus duodecadis]
MAEGGPGVHPGLRVERVTEATWRAYRDVRLAALIDSPRAFWTRYAEAAARTDDDWRTHATSGPGTWLAWDGDRPVGTVALWHADHQPAHEAYLVGMWVTAAARGSGVAATLVETAVAQARADGRTRVLLEVARENTRACRFYLSRGFVLTGTSGTMPWDPTCVEDGMVLDLGAGA